MPECQECSRSFEPTKWWRTFCSTECRQMFHRRKYRAEKIEHRLNGDDRGTKEERRAAKAAFTAFTQSLRRPDVEGVAPAPPLRRRF
jgi:hypothetical protein